MATEGMQALIERMKTDQAFHERVLAEPDPGARLALVQAEGYDCSAEDFTSPDAAVTDADLDGVAAGYGAGCMTLPCPFMFAG